MPTFRLQLAGSGIHLLALSTALLLNDALPAEDLLARINQIRSGLHRTPAR